MAQARERGELPTQERAGGLAEARVDIEPRLRKVVGYRHLPKLREALQRKTPNRSLHSYRAKPETTSTSGFGINPGSDLLSHTVTRAVPSAVEGLTTVFGMGTGVTPLLSPPGNGRPSRRSATSVKERTQPTQTVGLRDNPPSPKPSGESGLNTLQTAVSPRTTSQCK